MTGEEKEPAQMPSACGSPGYAIHEASPIIMKLRSLSSRIPGPEGDELLRDLARLESVLETIQHLHDPLPVKMRTESLQEAVSAALVLATSAGAAFSLRMEEGLGRSHVRSPHVSVALRNLIENASRHAHPPYSIQVTSSPGMLSILVSDGGPLSASAPGSGLGTAIARRMAESCGGELSDLSGDEGGAWVLTTPAVES